MEHPTLSIQTRTASGKQVRALRRAGQIPGIMYGHKQANLNVSIDAREITKLYSKVGSSALVDLTLDGKKSATVLIQAVQITARRREIEHVDLFAVNLKEKLRTSIPLTFIGTSEAVDTLGGILHTPKDEVQVECLPDALVQEFTVDLAALKTFEDTIKVSDLLVPQGIEVLDDIEELIASVSEPISEEELDLDSTVVENAAEVPAETEEGHVDAVTETK